MKNRINITLGIILIVDCIILSIIRFLAVGQSRVASYGDYVIGGFSGFLIMEGLLIPFYILIALAVIICIVLIYRFFMRRK